MVGAGWESPSVMLAAPLPVLSLPQERGHRGSRGQAWPRGLSSPQLEAPAATGGGGECVQQPAHQPAAAQPALLPESKKHDPASAHLEAGKPSIREGGGRYDPICASLPVLD